ncbi:MAG: hypothetical protein ACK5QS_17560 [Pseudanabaenaceae cyanobacterium]
MLTAIRDSSKLTPLAPTDTEFAALFPYEFNWIYKDDEGWHTQTRYPLSPRDLIAKWRSPDQIVGVRFGKTTNYAMLDIDLGSQYHPKQDAHSIERILEELEGIGLFSVLIVRSSDSKGLHLYYPLPEAVSSFGLACAVHHALTQSGLIVKSGQLEIFPNVKAYDTEYNGHRLPLQDGSYLLDCNLEPSTQDLKEFLTTWQSEAKWQDMTLLSNAIATAPRPQKTYIGKTKRDNSRWRSNLEYRIGIGWTGKGQTNELMFQIGQYGRVFEGIDSQSELASYIADRSRACNGFYTYSSHAHEVERLALDKAEYLMAHYYPWGSKPSHVKRKRIATVKPKTPIIERITQAIAQIKDQAFTTTRELLQTLAKSIRMSLTTLYKHRDLWEPLLKNCNTASSNDFEPKDSQDAESVESGQNQSESAVTVLGTNEVLGGGDATLIPSNPDLDQSPQSKKNKQTNNQTLNLNFSNQDSNHDLEYSPSPFFHIAAVTFEQNVPEPLPDNDFRQSNHDPANFATSILRKVKAIVTRQPAPQTAQNANDLRNGKGMSVMFEGAKWRIDCYSDVIVRIANDSGLTMYAKPSQLTPIPT